MDFCSMPTSRTSRGLAVGRGSGIAEAGLHQVDRGQDTLLDLAPGNGRPFRVDRLLEECGHEVTGMGLVGLTVDLTVGHVGAAESLGLLLKDRDEAQRGQLERGDHGQEGQTLPVLDHVLDHAQHCSRPSLEFGLLEHLGGDPRALGKAAEHAGVILAVLAAEVLDHRAPGLGIVTPDHRGHEPVREVGGEQ